MLKVQAQARMQLAKKRAWRERRYRDLRTYCREEQEQILMEIEDAVGALSGVATARVGATSVRDAASFSSVAAMAFRWGI